MILPVVLISSLLLFGLCKEDQGQQRILTLALPPRESECRIQYQIKVDNRTI
ncbi:hypothetical protein MTO96_005115, partial [Rhipicephalus appendiculatus]